MGSKDPLGEYMGRFPYPLISKGMAYYRQDKIEDARIQDGRVIAKVKGSEDHVYDVSISYKDRKYEGDCTCPYCYEHAECKHIYAVLLYMSKNNLLLDKKTSAKTIYSDMIHEKVPMTDSTSDKASDTTQKILSKKKTEGETLLKKIQDGIDSFYYISTSTRRLFQKLYSTKEYPVIAKSLRYINSTNDLETILNEISRTFPLNEQKEIFQCTEVGSDCFNQALITHIENHPETLFFFPISFFRSNSYVHPFLTMRLLHIACAYHYDELIQFYLDNNIYEDIIDNLFVLNYIKNNFPEQKWIDLFADKIEKYNLSRIEFAFIAPHLKEESKKHLLNMPEGLKFHRGSNELRPGVEYQSYAYISPLFVRQYFGLEKIKVDHTDLVDMLSFHHFFFKEYGKDAFRHFRLRFNAVIKAVKTPDFRSIVPGLLIILKEKDNYPEDFEDSFEKLRQYSLNSYSYKEPMASYLFAKLLAGQKNSLGFYEYK